jgi:hypothetical protein
MTVIGTTAGGKKIAMVSVAGPSSYATGGFTVRVSDVNRIDAVIWAFITGGYKIGGLTISGNAVTVVVHNYNYPATAAGPSTEVAAGTDLSGQTVTLCIIGS